MSMKNMITLCALAVGVTLIGACTTFLSSGQSLPAQHPEALAEGRVQCSECHEDQVKGVLKPFEAFNHTTMFVKYHRLYAGRDNHLCLSCHSSSFCTDCHAAEIEMKPSVKLANRPDRELIHRGDFRTRHMIEGKVDPGSCYRCHGRSNNELCISCHR